MGVRGIFFKKLHPMVIWQRGVAFLTTMACCHFDYTWFFECQTTPEGPIWKIFGQQIFQIDPNTLK